MRCQAARRTMKTDLLDDRHMVDVTSRTGPCLGLMVDLVSTFAMGCFAGVRKAMEGTGHFSRGHVGTLARRTESGAVLGNFSAGPKMQYGVAWCWSIPSLDWGSNVCLGLYHGRQTESWRETLLADQCWAGPDRGYHVCDHFLRCDPTIFR